MGSYEGGGYASGNYTDPMDSSSKNLKQMMDWRYTMSYPQNSNFWVQGSIDKRFKAGDQSMLSMIYGDNNYFQSRKFFFNLIRRHINMVTGYQRRNRKSTITVPTNETDDLADQYNKVLKWTEERDGFQEYLSQCFEGSCDTGINLLHLYPDYTYDSVSGDLFTDCVGWCNFLIDPYFRKQDLSDCGFIWRRRWVDAEGAIALMPEREKDIRKMKSAKMRDGRFSLQAELLNLDTNRLMPYDEFFYRDTREATMIIDPKSGESVEWEKDVDEVDGEMEQVLQMQPWLIVKKMRVPTVKMGVCISDHVFYHGKNLLNIDSYPFVPSLCYHEPDIQSYVWRVQGIIRNLRDAQYLYNMRKVIEMDLLQSQVQNAWIYPVDVVVDPKAFRQTQNGCVIPLKAGHLPGEIQRLDPQGLPPTVIELSRSLADDITKICGVNEELLGSAVDDKAGILAMLRQGAGLTTLQGIFDKLDYSQRLYGKIRLEAIRKNFSKGKIRNILGVDAAPEFFKSYSMKYSIAVEEGSYTTTQRQMELEQLLHFKQIGMPIPDESILSAAFITNKKKIIEQMQKTAQQEQQQQQAQMQQQQQIEGAKLMESYAKAKSELAREKDLMASASEKIAKIGMLEGEGEYKRTEAELNLVKEMILLEDADLEAMKKAFELAQAIRMANQPQELPAQQAQEAI